MIFHLAPCGEEGGGGKGLGAFPLTESKTKTRETITGAECVWRGNARRVKATP